MKMIRSLEQTASLPEGAIKQRILAEQARLLADFPGVYDPAAHGWFLLVETPDDLKQPVVPNSPITLLQVIQEKRYEWLENWVTRYELVWVIDGCEAVTIYLPDDVLVNYPAVQTFLNEQDVAGA